MDLNGAKELLAWMRAEGLASARVGDVALVLGEQPEAPQAWSPDDPRLVQRPRYYDDPLDDPDLYDGENVPGLEEPAPRAEGTVR